MTRQSENRKGALRCISVCTNNRWQYFIQLYIMKSVSKVIKEPWNLFILIWTLVEHLMLGWALGSSPWQLYSAILCFCADPLCSSQMQPWMSDCCYIYMFLLLNIHGSGVHTVLFWLLRGWWHVKLLLSLHILCTPYNHAPICSITLFEATFKIQDYFIISFKKLKRGSHTHTHTHTRMCTHYSDVWTNLSIQKWYWVQTVLDFGTQNHPPDGRIS